MCTKYFWIEKENNPTFIDTDRRQIVRRIRAKNANMRLDCERTQSTLSTYILVYLSQPRKLLQMVQIMRVLLYIHI